MKRVILLSACISDHEPMRHTNQTVGTGFTPVAETLEWVRQSIRHVQEVAPFLEF